MELNQRQNQLQRSKEKKQTLQPMWGARRQWELK